MRPLLEECYLLLLVLRCEAGKAITSVLWVFDAGRNRVVAYLGLPYLRLNVSLSCLVVRGLLFARLSYSLLPIYFISMRSALP